MTQYFYSILIGALVLLSSCATTMSPMQVNTTLPTLTETEYIPQARVEELINSGKCKNLIENRTYVAPIGLTVSQELKAGAKGIDEWVIIDGGNAYLLVNYTWKTIDDLGSTQLHLTFNTMVCE